MREGNKNKLSEENRNKILDAFIKRGDIEYFTKLVNNKDIAENEYNVSVSSYVEQRDDKEVIDIKVLNKEIEEIVKRENILRKEIDKIVKELEGGS